MNSVVDDVVVTDTDEENSRNVSNCPAGYWMSKSSWRVHHHCASSSVSDRRTWRLVQSSPWRGTLRRRRRPLSPTWICLRLVPTAKRSWWMERLFIRGRATQISSAPLPAFWNFTKWNKLRRRATSAFSESHSSLIHFILNVLQLHSSQLYLHISGVKDLILPRSLRAITQSQDVLQAPVDTEGTVKDFCSQTCLSSFNYKKIMSTKMPITPVASQSQCSICSRYCIVRDKGTDILFFLIVIMKNAAEVVLFNQSCSYNPFIDMTYNTKNKGL